MNTKIKRGNLLIKGKTKSMFGVKGKEDLVIGEYGDFITAHNDPNLTREFEGKGANSNIVNCIMFQLLNQAGIPTAFVEQLSPKEFLALNCQMIPLEVVARRHRVGSDIKRHPHVESGTRCHWLRVEFFLKTTDGQLKDSDGKILIEGLTPEQDDPLIDNPFDLDLEWQLVHPKQPLETDGSKLGTVAAYRVIPYACVTDIMRTMEKMTKDVFLTIEKAWSSLGLRLVDLKIEFGITLSGELVVADVIDSDSWRLWRPTKDGGWKDVSKQSFRDITDKDDPDELDRIRANYAYVAEMAQRLVS